ncbi:hypothetical protein Tco_0373062, partial [Tanacetum coccineum]
MHSYLQFISFDHLAVLTPSTSSINGPTENVVDEAIYEEMDDSLEKAATTATSLDAEHDRDSGPKRQETMGDTIAQT